MEEICPIRLPVPLSRVGAPSQVFVPPGQKRTGLHHFSERSHSAGEARVLGVHVAPSTPVQGQTQEGTLDQALLATLQMENRPDGGRGLTGLGSTRTVAEQTPQPHAYHSPRPSHPQSPLQNQ